MELSKDTRLKDLLDAYPTLKNQLPEINPKFAMINSPMGKIMIHRVTLSDMSEKSGMDFDVLIEGIRALIQ